MCVCVCVIRIEFNRFVYNTSACVCVCVCRAEKDRERILVINQSGLKRLESLEDKWDGDGKSAESEKEREQFVTNGRNEKVTAVNTPFTVK